MRDQPNRLQTQPLVDHQTATPWRIEGSWKPKTMAAMGDQAIVTTDSEKDIESTATGGSSDKVSPQSGGKLYLMLSCLFDFESGNSIFGASQSRHKNAKTSVHQRFTLCELCSSARSACG